MTLTTTFLCLFFRSVFLSDLPCEEQDLRLMHSEFYKKNNSNPGKNKIMKINIITNLFGGKVPKLTNFNTSSFLFSFRSKKKQLINEKPSTNDPKRKGKKVITSHMTHVFVLFNNWKSRAFFYEITPMISITRAHMNSAHAFFRAVSFVPSDSMRKLINNFSHNSRWGFAKIYSWIK